MIITGLLAVILFYNAGAQKTYPIAARQVIQQSSCNNCVTCSTACDSTTLCLKCWSQFQIHVTTAFWGVKEHAKGYGCGENLFEECSNFSNPETVKETVMNSCEGHQSCQVRAAKEVLGNPCNSTLSSLYLEVCYQCLVNVPTRPTMTTTTIQTTTLKSHECERLPDDADWKLVKTGKTLKIECDEDESIDIKMAIFGIRSRDCRDEDMVNVENKGSRWKTFKTLYDKCQGWQECTLKVKPRLFGARNSRKTVLQVAYVCSDKKLWENNKGGVLKCKGKNLIFLNIVTNPQCRKYLEKTCQRKRKCKAGTCQLKYSCQQPRKYHKKRDGRDGSGESDGSGEGSEGSEEYDEDESDEDESDEGDSDEPPFDPYAITTHAPAPVNPYMNCRYQHYDGKWYATNSACPDTTPPECVDNPNAPGCPGGGGPSNITQTVEEDRK